MIPSAPCDPPSDLLSEIGPPGDLLVGRLLNFAQFRTPNENRTPFSVTVCLEPGCCAVAEGDDDGESSARPTPAIIATAAVTGSLATLIMLILPRSVAERRALAHRSVLVQRTYGWVRKPS